MLHGVGDSSHLLSAPSPTASSQAPHPTFLSIPHSINNLIPFICLPSQPQLSPHSFPFTSHTGQAAPCLWPTCTKHTRFVSLCFLPLPLAACWCSYFGLSLWGAGVSISPSMLMATPCSQLRERALNQRDPIFLLFAAELNKSVLSPKNYIAKMWYLFFLLL